MAKKTIITHSGGFHADDLFAVETILRLYEKSGIAREEIQIIRTRDEGIISRGDTVVDVGGIFDPGTFRFDHHQEGGASVRENGVPYAAFGLVWRAFGEEIVGSAYAMRVIDERLVQTIDALDNGVDIFGESEVDIPHRYLLQNVFRSLQPTWNEHTYTMDEAFLKALEIVRLILQREIVHALSKEEGSSKALEQYISTKDLFPGLLILDDHYPYADVVERHPEIVYVVKPSEDEASWKARAVRTSTAEFRLRKPFPENWAGKRDDEVARITGVPDALFVHNKRFIAVARSKEGALALAQKALEL